ncbi:MAG: hypothetical protein KAT79_01675, partial [candidate division Zixibacteria bacterium]|nr:hypothetical protein [candidate division Zixibacteria bacterium]
MARRKIPTKSELIQLQKIHKTDEKIGEYLGGVPAYLIAYWRRKKNVARHSVPKFSEKEIRSLWERFGDDDKCGLELGISKAAFYTWRRRYGIREKPAFLKLEQLEFNFPGVKTQRHTDTLYGKQASVQKILARAASVEKVEVGETITVEPHLVIARDPSGTIINEFQKLGAEYVFNPARLAISPLGQVEENVAVDSSAYTATREFARRQGIKAFYDIRDGYTNQVILEKAHLLPGQLALCNDPQGPVFGCLNACAETVDAAMIARTWAEGKIDLEVPSTTFIEINGRRSRGVYARDIGLSAVGQLATYDLVGKAIELSGSVVSHMNIGERFSLAGLIRDTGARTAIIPFDSITRRFLTGRTMQEYFPVVSDKDAVYENLYKINIDQLVPQVACPGSITSVKAAAELEGVAVEQIILGTCTSGRFADLRVAADILKGRKVHPDCRLIIIPASRTVQLEAL